MKALTIFQPYAALIVAGIKDIENRSWSTSYRGSLLIHAGVKAYASKPGLDVPADMPVQFGGVIGRVDLVDVITKSDSPWFAGPFGFVLRNPELLPFRPARGYQKLFDIER